MKYPVQCRRFGGTKFTECLVDERGLIFDCRYCDRKNPLPECVDCAQDTLKLAEKNLKELFEKFGTEIQNEE